MQRQTIGEMVITGRLLLFMMGQLMGLTKEYMLVFIVQFVDIDAQFACQYLEQNGQYINRFGVKDMQRQTIGEMIIGGRISLLVRCFCVVFIKGFCLPLGIDCCSSNSADGSNSFNLTQVFGRFINFVPQTYIFVYENILFPYAAKRNFKLKQEGSCSSDYRLLGFVVLIFVIRRCLINDVYEILNCMICGVLFSFRV